MVPGDSTRPISDRVKESLFNILREDIPGCSMLDLFAGTGSVGIEALSRGAEFVRFVDKDRRAIQTVRENLAITKLEDKAQVTLMDAFTLLGREPDRAFDYVYVAPPQYKELWKKAILSLDARPDWVVDDGWLVAQVDPREYEGLTLEHFDEFDQRRYGNTLLIFYERREQVNDE
jgi:16S rRNA (guanine(966)-N(2))-methyltransferase RsmD